MVQPIDTRSEVCLVESLDIGSFFSALLGAVSALGGVVITQRSARKTAHADRIWAERTAAYGALYELLEADSRILRLDLETLPEDSHAVLDNPLPPEVTRKLYLFGSRAVLQGYREYYDAVATVLNGPANGMPVIPALRNARTRGDKLQQLISSETRGD